MATKKDVFISWSGELSKRLAQAVGEWLKDALQFVEPFFTPDNVEKGTKWLSEISSEMEKSDCGIICLTKENLGSPWILFEAGALSKKFRSHVCTLLFDVAKAEVKFPLAMFQATDFTRDDFRRLFETINNTGGDLSLKEPGITRAFDKWWPDLEEKVNKIRAQYKPITQDTARPTEEMVKEILELTRVHVQRDESRWSNVDAQQAVTRWIDQHVGRPDVSASYTVPMDSSVPLVRVVGSPVNFASGSPLNFTSGSPGPNSPPEHIKGG